MFFRWDGSRVVLEEPDNFRSFKVVLSASDVSHARPDEGLRALGVFESDEVFWVSRNALLEWPACAGRAGWRENVEAMIAKAAAHGWVDPATEAIKAHVDRGEALP